jgi:hypothetical protein
MNVVLLCSSEEQEMDCIQVGAILVRFDDGKSLALTEDSLRRVGLDRLDASEHLDGWLRTRADEFRGGDLKMVP